MVPDELRLVWTEFEVVGLSGLWEGFGSETVPCTQPELDQETTTAQIQMSGLLVAAGPERGAAVCYRGWKRKHGAASSCWRARSQTPTEQTAGGGGGRAGQEEGWQVQRRRVEGGGGRLSFISRRGGRRGGVQEAVEEEQKHPNLKITLFTLQIKVFIKTQSGPKVLIRSLSSEPVSGSGSPTVWRLVSDPGPDLWSDPDLDLKNLF